MYWPKRTGLESRTSTELASLKFQIDAAAKTYVVFFFNLAAHFS
jgi:hypothetical protein